MLSISTGLLNSVLTGGSIADSLYGAQFVIYSGTIPAHANQPISDDSVILCVIKDPTSSHITWVPSADGSTFLSKPDTEEWSGLVLASGVAKYFRIEFSGDTKEYSTDEARIQGTVDNGLAILNMNPEFVEGQKKFIDYFSLGYPKPANA